jgi:hypothetical protein
MPLQWSCQIGRRKLPVPALARRLLGMGIVATVAADLTAVGERMASLPPQPPHNFEHVAASIPVPGVLASGNSVFLTISLGLASP